MSHWPRFFTLLVLCLACAAGPARAQTRQPIPPLAAHVLDASGTLSADAKQALENKLTTFERSHGSQIVVLMVPSTKPETIEAYGARVADAWRLGRLGVGDGVLVLVARDDRRARIEVAQALKISIPDSAAKSIIDSAMQPAFRKGDFAGGLDAAASQLIARISGAALPQPYPDQAARAAEAAVAEGHAPVPAGAGLGAPRDGFQWIDLAIFLFVAVAFVVRPLRNALGRKFGALALGLGVGAVALFATGSLALACIAACVALLWGLFQGNDSTPRQTRIDARQARHHGVLDHAVPNSGWSTVGGLKGGSGLGTGGLGGSGGSAGSGRPGRDSEGGAAFDASGTGGGDFHSGGGGDFGGSGASGDW